LKKHRNMCIYVRMWLIGLTNVFSCYLCREHVEMPSLEVFKGSVLTCSRCKKKVNPIHMSYYIQNQLIKEVPDAKYLGVTIDQHLTRNEQVRQITSKANKLQQCQNFLQRNIRSCLINIKTTCYQSMIRSCIDCLVTLYPDKHAINRICTKEVCQICIE